MLVGGEFVESGMPVGYPKKKKNGKETIGYKGLEINYTICDRVVNLESQACRLKPWESVK